MSSINELENEENIFYTKKGFLQKSRGNSSNGSYILFELTKEIE